MKNLNEWKKEQQREEAEVAEFLVIFGFLMLCIVAMAS
jgi:hypothetical protein